MIPASALLVQAPTRRLPNKDVVKLLLGPLVYPSQSARWTTFLDRHPLLAELAQRHPRLLHKIYRPYASNTLSCSQRVDLLIGHYESLFGLGLAKVLNELAVRPLSICEFAAKSGAPYRLQLCAFDDAYREGELCIKLMSGRTCLYSITFLLVRSGSALHLKIGCLQGLRSADAQAMIKQTTKDLYGCRPKSLLIATVRELAAGLGCTTLQLVSNQNRICVNWRRRRRVSSNYDETWQELGAVKRPDGNFELAVANHGMTPLSAVPSHKRAEARRRIGLLETVFADVQRGLERARLRYSA